MLRNQTREYSASPHAGWHLIKLIKTFVLLLLDVVQPSKFCDSWLLVVCEIRKSRRWHCQPLLIDSSTYRVVS